MEVKPMKKKKQFVKPKVMAKSKIIRPTNCCSLAGGK